MPSLVEEWYRFKHESRTRAYVENFDSINTALNSIQIYKAPRTIESFEQDAWTLHGKLAPATEGTIDLPFYIMFKLNGGKDSPYPVVNNYDVATYDPTHDDGVWLRYPISVSFTVTKYIFETKIMYDETSDLYYSFGVTMLRNESRIWFQIYNGTLTAYIDSGGTRETVSLGSVARGVWYTIKAITDGEITKLYVDGNLISTVVKSISNMMPESIYVDGTTEDQVNGYFDYIDIKLNGTENDAFLYEIRGNGYARRILEKHTYSPSITLCDGDEFRFDQYMDSTRYTKFSTDGFYITQDGDTIKIKGTDTSERSYPLTDGVWYNIRAIFYSLYGKSAMKVRVYDSSGTLVYEFAPVYSTVKNPFENPLFSTQSGYSGLIDNLEVWR